MMDAREREMGCRPAEEVKRELRALEAEKVTRYMDLVIEEVSPSKISSHIKGDVIKLLERLRDQEALRILRGKQ